MVADEALFFESSGVRFLMGWFSCAFVGGCDPDASAADWAA